MAEQIRKYRYLLYALLLLLPTYAGMRAEYFLFFVVAVLIGERSTIIEGTRNLFSDPSQKRNKFIFLGVILLMVFALINKLVNGQEILCVKDYYAPFYLFPFLILTACLSYSRMLFFGIILLTAGESIVGLFEYLSGVRSIVLDLGDFNRIEDYSLLYNSRVYGLSSNSSILGYKVLLSFIIIDFCKLKNWQDWSIRGVLLIGLLISFSRIAIIVLLIYWLLRLILINRKVLHRKYISNSSVQYVVFVVLLSLICFKPLMYQLSRGGHEAESVLFVEEDPNMINSCALSHALPIQGAEVDLEKQGWGDKLMLSAENVQSSGRKLIWLNYLNYIEDNLWFGNGSDKLMLRAWVADEGHYKLVHAHNSILMLVSTYGLFLAILFVAFYLYYWKGYNWIPIIAIVLYSMGNYGIFWGFSAMDVILLILMSHKIKLSYEHT